MKKREIKLGFCTMSENINGKTFKVSHGGVNLPFEMYSMEYIWKELKRYLC